MCFKSQVLRRVHLLLCLHALPLLQWRIPLACTMSSWQPSNTEQRINEHRHLLSMSKKYLMRWLPEMFNHSLNLVQNCIKILRTLSSHKVHCCDTADHAHGFQVVFLCSAALRECLTQLQLSPPIRCHNGVLAISSG